ncbi:MAG: DUF262 domain-containing protein [Dysgonamonadaceae bacterium]|jgi:uncharacterized protein with ParB-like and HNH nuclease domain|nr:DUF262 domain-containing protein [Dysgonamonadaceae bacterium]
MQNQTENKIDAKGKSLRELLESKKYSIDYFQREYKWQRKHIEQLLIDLEEAFYDSYQENHSISDVSDYNSYFMGPIILCEKSGVMSIIDGQQRLTSMTLLLIYVNNIQRNREDAEPVENMIFSRKHGRNSFNIEVEERQDVLDALFKNETYETSEVLNHSIINTVERYNDICELFPESLKDEKLPLFIDWIKEKLFFVEILAYSDKNAYTIFETMNDRGYNLTPSEMLKGFLLSKVENEDELIELNSIWRNQISKLHQYSVDEDLEFFRAWFRGRFAETMRAQAAGAKNEDFEKIGTSFHRWVKENSKKLELKNSKSHYFFIKSDFVFYSNLYLKIKELESKPVKGLERINYSTYWTIATSLSYPLYLSPITKADEEKTINEKLSIISGFIERFVFFRSTNFNPISQTAVRYTLFNLVKKVRGLDVENLTITLKDYLSSMDADFESIRKLTVYNTNRKFLKYILSRLTIQANVLCDIETDFYDLITARRKAGNNLHFIISDNFDEYATLFADDEEFQNFRGNIGALSLLRKDYHQNKNLTNTNILFKLTKPNSLTDSEISCLEAKLNVPQTLEISKEWLQERQDFLIGLASEIWGIENLGKD